MEIKPIAEKHMLSELVAGFDASKDVEDEDLVAYGGDLVIRPAYQREFIYGKKEESDVINSLLHGYPIGIFYFVERDGKDGSAKYELLDGQQRTLSICRFVTGLTTVTIDGDEKHFSDLSVANQEKILNTSLIIYKCIGGNDAEIVDWFGIVSKPGKSLTEQELLNAKFACGSDWQRSAKEYFSKSNCKAKLTFGEWLCKSGTDAYKRQEVLGKVLKWAAAYKNGKDKATREDVAKYMTSCAGQPNANGLWFYVEDVFAWAKDLFEADNIIDPKRYQVEWGYLYNRFHNKVVLYKPTMREKLRNVIENADASSRTGIYEFALTDFENEQFLNKRIFDERTKDRLYSKQGRMCPLCIQAGDMTIYEESEMQADHIKPWSIGGKTESSNCILLCRKHNLWKSDDRIAYLESIGSPLNDDEKRLLTTHVIK